MNDTLLSCNTYISVQSFDWENRYDWYVAKQTPIRNFQSNVETFALTAFGRNTPIFHTGLNVIPTFYQ